VVSTLVLSAALTGPLALYLSVRAFGDGGSPTDDQPVAGLAADHHGSVGPFAALFVSAWLSGDDLTVFNPTLIGEPTGLLVDQVAPVRVSSSSPGFFDVVVAAEAIEYLPASEEEYRQLGLRFYAVGVETTPEGQLLALGAPAVVAAPEAPVAAPLAVTEFETPSTPEQQVVAETLRGFFAAYLTGQGEIELFTSPTAAISAIQPPVAGSVAVGRLGWGPVPGLDDGDLRLVRVEVDAARATGRERFEYWLVAALRDGRWEVAQLLPAPVVVGRATATTPR
jgi:hypothetical protein